MARDDVKSELRCRRSGQEDRGNPPTVYLVTAGAVDSFYLPKVSFNIPATDAVPSGDRERRLPGRVCQLVLVAAGSRRMVA